MPDQIVLKNHFLLVYYQQRTCYTERIMGDVAAIAPLKRIGVKMPQKFSHLFNYLINQRATFDCLCYFVINYSIFSPPV